MLVERMVQEGRTEDEIVAAVEEAEIRPAPPARRRVDHRPAGRWSRLVRARRPR
jgi:hypothetical protein